MAGGNKEWDFKTPPGGAGSSSKPAKPPTFKVVLEILSASDLPKVDRIGHIDAYVEVKVNDGEKGVVTKHKTKVVKKEKSPVWNDRLELFLEDTELFLQVYDDNRIGKPEYIGAVHFPSLTKLPQVQKSFPIIGDKNKERGKITICSKVNAIEQAKEAMFNITGDIGQLSLEVISASNLPSVDTMGSADPFVVVTLKDKEIIRTEVVKNDINPSWRGQPSAKKKIDCLVESPMKIEVFDWNRFGKPTPLGVLEFPSLSSPKLHGGEFSYTLEKHPDNTVPKKGSITLRLAWKNIEGRKNLMASLKSAMKQENGELTISIVSAENLKSGWRTRPMVRVFLGTNNEIMSTPAEKGSNPAWRGNPRCSKTLNVHRSDVVRAEVWDGRSFLGQVRLVLTDEKTMVGEHAYTLTSGATPATQSEDISGELTISLKWKDLDKALLGPLKMAMKEPWGSFFIELSKVSGLPKMDTFGSCDPFVKVYLGGKLLFETEVMKGKRDAVFHGLESSSRNIVTKSDEPLRIEVWDWDRASSDEFIGEVSFDSLQDPKLRAGEETYKLQPGSTNETKGSSTTPEGNVSFFVKWKDMPNGPNPPLHMTKPYGRLSVKVEACVDLPKTDTIGTSDPFVTVEIDDEMVLQTDVASGLNPVWGEKSVKSRLLDYPCRADASLRVRVMDKDTLTLDDFVGEVAFPNMKEAAKKRDLFGGEFPYNLVNKDRKHLTAQVVLELEWKNDDKEALKIGGGSELGLFTLAVIKCFSLKDADRFGTSDPYCVVKLNDNQWFRTRTIKDRIDPDWSAESDAQQKITVEGRSALSVQVWDEDKGSQGDFLGEVRFESLAKMMEGQTQYKLLSNPELSKEEVTGSIVLSANWEKSESKAIGEGFGVVEISPVKLLGPLTSDVHVIVDVTGYPCSHQQEYKWKYEVAKKHFSDFVPIYEVLNKSTNVPIAFTIGKERFKQNISRLYTGEFSYKVGRFWIVLNTEFQQQEKEKLLRGNGIHALEVTVLRARGLAIGDVDLRSSDPRVMIMVDGRNVMVDDPDGGGPIPHTTATKNQTLHPIWKTVGDKKCADVEVSASSSLQFAVFDVDEGEEDQYLGTASVKCSMLESGVNKADVIREQGKNKRALQEGCLFFEVRKSEKPVSAASKSKLLTSKTKFGRLDVELLLLKGSKGNLSVSPVSSDKITELNASERKGEFLVDFSDIIQFTVDEDVKEVEKRVGMELFDGENTIVFGSRSDIIAKLLVSWTDLEKPAKEDKVEKSKERKEPQKTPAALESDFGEMIFSNLKLTGLPTLRPEDHEELICTFFAELDGKTVDRSRTIAHTTRGPGKAAWKHQTPSLILPSKKCTIKVNIVEMATRALEGQIKIPDPVLCQGKQTFLLEGQPYGQEAKFHLVGVFRPSENKTALEARQREKEERFERDAKKRAKALREAGQAEGEDDDLLNRSVEAKQIEVLLNETTSKMEGKIGELRQENAKLAQKLEVQETQVKEAKELLEAEKLAAKRRKAKEKKAESTKAQKPRREKAPDPTVSEETTKLIVTMLKSESEARTKEFRSMLQTMSVMEQKRLEEETMKKKKKDKQIKSMKEAVERIQEEQAKELEASKLAMSIQKKKKTRKKPVEERAKPQASTNQPVEYMEKTMEKLLESVQQLKEVAEQQTKASSAEDLELKAGSSNWKDEEERKYLEFLARKTEEYESRERSRQMKELRESLELYKETINDGMLKEVDTDIRNIRKKMGKKPDVSFEELARSVSPMSRSRVMNKYTVAGGSIVGPGKKPRPKPPGVKNSFDDPSPVSREEIEEHFGTVKAVVNEKRHKLASGDNAPSTLHTSSHDLGSSVLRSSLEAGSIPVALVPKDQLAMLTSSVQGLPSKKSPKSSLKSSSLKGSMSNSKARGTNISQTRKEHSSRPRSLQYLHPISIDRAEYAVEEKQGQVDEDSDPEAELFDAITDFHESFRSDKLTSSGKALPGKSTRSAVGGGGFGFRQPMRRKKGWS